MNLHEITPWNWFKHDKKAKLKKGADASRGWHPVESLQREVDGIFGKFFEEFDTHFPEKDTRAHNSILLYPKTDISETAKNYKVAIELPGVERKDVQISVIDKCLVVKGTKNHLKEEKNENFHKIERMYGSFERVISLPHNVNEENIIAELRDGVLYIDLGKKSAPASEVKKVEIK